MVDLIPYVPSLLPTLHTMLKSQGYYGIADIQNDTLPKIGFVAINWVADDMGVPVAAGFLRMVEGGFAQIDTLMTNAMQPAKMRDDTINLVVDRLIKEAKSLNLNGVLATSKDENTLKRALSIGFHIVEGHKVLGLPLKERPQRG